MEKENKKVVKGNIKLSKINPSNQSIKISSEKNSDENCRSKELIAATAEAALKMETEKFIRKVLMLEGVG